MNKKRKENLCTKAEVSVHELFKIKKKSKSQKEEKAKEWLVIFTVPTPPHSIFLYNLLINILSRIYNALN